MKPATNSKIDVRQCFAGVFAGKQVVVTGHTGFKGAWLSEWLLQLGANVTGLALAPPTTPSLFEQLNLGSRLNHVLGDIRDIAVVARVIQHVKPDFVFHLAAQPLVRRSYGEPVETYATNVMGTAHVLDALRRADRACVGVMITTDKCYENKEWVHSYREEDAMGGYDPYSSSKGAAELVIAAYRRSYFSGLDTHVRIASARAGNVIGGGDWAVDRIVPDCVRALQRGDAIPIRNKFATRPWQHVLEPLSGYLWLAACLANPRLAPCSIGLSDYQLVSFSSQLASAYNFGPDLASNRSVAELVQEIVRHWPGRWEDKSEAQAVHEAKHLNLAIDKAHHHLQWSPVWDFERSVAETVAWYRCNSHSPETIPSLTRSQLTEFTDSARLLGRRWTVTSLEAIAADHDNLRH